MILKTILKSIDENFVLNIDGSEQSYESGDSALDAIDPAVVYTIKKIGVKEGKLYIAAADQTKALRQQNKIWMEEEKTKTGVEPGFF